MSKHNNMTLREVEIYLRSHGIQKSGFNAIRSALVDDAMRQADAMQLNRIYTALALTLHRHLGFGDKRVSATMHSFDDLMGSVARGECTWTDLMHQCEQELNIVIRCTEDFSEIEEEIQKKMEG